jgi:cell division protein FtsW
MPIFHRFCLLLSISILFVMGLVMIFNTSSAEVLDLSLNKSTHIALFRQMIYGVIGLGLALAITKVGYSRLIAWSPLLLVLFSLLLILTLIPGIGREVNGSKRWIGIGGFSFQPSEFVKYIIPMYIIYRLRDVQPENLPYKDFLKLIGTVLIPVFLILIEPNNGTAGVIGIVILVMCIITRMPSKFWAIPLGVLAIIGSITAYHLPYVASRIHVYLHPELDLLGKGHQPYQAKIASGSGQLFGRGPGNSLQKLSYLPEAQNDYIAAIYAEEFGFVGMTILILLYMVVAYVGFSTAYKCPDRSGYYLAATITFLICFQVFMNLGVVSGILPSTGLNLPFFSQGGTSLMTNTVGIGMVLDIGRQKVKQKIWQPSAL